MSRARTLGQLLTELRGELKMSQSPALGANMRDTLVWALQRTQQELWTNYWWPFLRADQQLTANIGQTHYSISDVDVAGIKRVFSRDQAGDDWVPVLPHSDPSEVLAYDTPSAPGDRALRWWTEFDTAANVEQLVIWPEPTEQHQLLVRGQRPLLPFTDDAHNCTLDGTLLVMAAAVEFIADDRKESAQSKQARVRDYLRKLLARQGGSRRAGPIMVGRGSSGPGRFLRRGLDYMT